MLSWYSATMLPPGRLAFLTIASLPWHEPQVASRFATWVRDAARWISGCRACHGSRCRSPPPCADLARLRVRGRLVLLDGRLVAAGAVRRFQLRLVRQFLGGDVGVAVCALELHLPCTEPAKTLASTAIDLPPRTSHPGRHGTSCNSRSDRVARRRLRPGGFCIERKRERQGGQGEQAGQQARQVGVCMMSPRIELLGIQRRRAVYAHQGALLCLMARAVLHASPRPR